MTIVGFNFTKLSCEKKKKAVGKVNVANKLNITDVKEAKLSLGNSKQKGLDFIFEYVSTYQPDIGSINLTGHVVYMEKEDVVNDVLKNWEKNKKLSKEITAKIYNSVLTKCSVQSLIMSRDINLPPNLPMPKIRTDGK